MIVGDPGADGLPQPIAFSLDAGLLWRGPGLMALELRGEQSDEEAEQDGSRVGWLSAWLQSHDPLHDQASLGVADPGSFLKHLDGIEAEARSLDLEEIVEPVKCGGEAVVKHMR